MFKGILFALTACFIWGLLFVVPQFMEGFSSLEVCLGRYTFYGALSSCILLRGWFKGGYRYPLPVWLQAVVYSLSCTFGYYVFFILGMRYSSPAVCALILGISPIAIAFYGNWKEKEGNFKKLLIPAFLIIIGLIVINAPQFSDNPSSSTYLIGLISSFIALFSWSFYVIANAQFLKKHPEVSFGEWSTLIGVSALFWSIVFGSIFYFFGGKIFDVGKYVSFNPELKQFLVGSAILGLLCSWVGAFFWNRASFHLPVSLAGQLTIFETIFGLCFVYMLDRRFPPFMEALGIALFLAAIAYAIRLSTKTAAKVDPALAKE